MLSVSALFYFDSKKCLMQLLCTTPKSANIYWAKIKMAVLAGGASSAIVWGITYMKYFLSYELDGIFYSIPEFGGMPYFALILGLPVLLVGIGYYKNRLSSTYT